MAMGSAFHFVESCPSCFHPPFWEKERKWIDESFQSQLSAHRILIGLLVNNSKQNMGGTTNESPCMLDRSGRSRIDRIINLAPCLQSSPRFNRGMRGTISFVYQVRQLLSVCWHSPLLMSLWIKFPPTHSLQKISQSTKEHCKKRGVCMLSCFSHVQLFATLWTAARQAPLSVGFSRQEYWDGLPFTPPVDLPDPGINPKSLTSPALAAGFLTTSSWAAMTKNHLCN